ncbi:MAG: PAS domain S-box protein [Candidatus Krumholzibacteriota bacterium]|nr:PAS domain S-box protein [Candidatus Krumholzibacteriota bacterium]
MESKDSFTIEGKYDISDTVNIDRLEDILKSFARANGYSCELYSNPDCQLLISTGMPVICGGFHRKYSESGEKCRKSNLKLNKKIKKGKKAVISRCDNGLIRGQAPIVINGVYLADLIIGPVLFEKPEPEWFRKQAKNYGYDSEKYLETLEEVKVVKEEDFRESLSFLREIIVILAERGLSEIQSSLKVREAQESKNNLYTTLRSIGEAVISTDMEGRIAHMNPVSENLTGWSIEEARGKQLTEVFHIVNSRTEEKAPNPVDKVLKEGVVVGLANHTKLIAGDGKEFQIADSASPIRDENGNITGVVLVFRDVTDEYKKSQQLKENLELLSATFQSIQDGVSVLERDLTISYVNPVMEKWYGAKMPLVGGKCYFCYHGRDNPCEPCPSLRCMETGKKEFDIVPGPPEPDSPVEWIELYSYPIIDEETGKVSGVVEFVRDITKQKRTRDNLSRSKKILARTERIANVGSWEWDIAGDSVTWSDELFSIFNIDPEEEPPSWKEHPSLYHPDDMELLKRAVEKAVSEGVPYELELRALPRGGGTRICLSRGFPDTDSDGNVFRLYGSFQDITELKITKQKLRKSRDNLETTLNSIGDAVISTDTEGRIAHMNPVAENLTGWSIEEARGKQLTEVFHIVNSRTEEKAPNPVDKVLKEGVVVGLANHTKLIAGDGKEYQIADSGSPIRNTEGETTGVVLVFRDVTEKYRIREELRRSEELLSLAMSIKNEGIWDWDLTTDDVYFDPRYYKMAGYRVDEFPPRLDEFKKRVHPDDIEYVMNRASEHLEGKIDNFNVEFRFKRKDGGWMWIQGRGMVVERDEKGSPTRFVGTHTDITERKYAEEALKESEEKYRTLVSSMSDMIFLLDCDDRFQEIHSKPGNVLLAEPEEFLGKRIQEVMPSSIIDMYEKSAEEVRRSGETRRFEYPLRIGDRDMWFLATLDLHKDEESVVADIRDITERKEAQEALQRMQKLESVGTLAGGIAHDFNNILTGVYGNIELARLELSEDHQSYKHIETAHKSLERARHLTKQLLTFARGGEPLLESVNIKELVRDSVRFNLSGSSIEASLNLPDDLWMVKADRGQMSHVLANLIINAKEAMSMGGVIHIEAENVEEAGGECASRLSGDYVMITVRDEGVGIPEKFLGSVFDPYFTTKKAGSGLGLSIAYSIINKHDGHISVQSEPGKGAAFALFLPAEKSSEIEGKEEAETDRKPSKNLGEVLLMDDEKAVREVSARMLKAIGYNTDLAVNGEEALEKYISALKKGNPFDVVIADLTVPGGMGGKELSEKILTADPNAKVIVISGYSTDPVMAGYTDYGFAGRIVKPFEIKDLRREITRVIKE